MNTSDEALLAFPMHGQHKFSNEGYRTRDGHLIEWFGRLLSEKGAVRVVSRPEPKVLAFQRTYGRDSVARNTLPVNTNTWRVPTSRDRQRWWVDSLDSYKKAVPAVSTPVITWNPFLAISDVWGRVRASGQPIAFDLLDDWTIHFAFEGIRRQVDRAYRASFDTVDHVFANSEGTLELAHRYGRSDATLLLNGTDPERFATESRATGPLTIGYVGKIGKRVDLDLILAAAKEFPKWQFVFAGPILDAEYREPLSSLSNIKLLGDVHYDLVPQLLTTFDLGWVPHRVGAGEVGGDVIKTYEYRAAGLPVLTTPIAGVSDRGFTEVSVVPAGSQVAWLRDNLTDVTRLPRRPESIAADMTWQNKANHILRSLGLSERD